MASAVSIGCSWCVDFGYWISSQEGVNAEKLRAVPRWRDSDVFTDLERRVMAYAEAVTATPPTQRIPPLVIALRTDQRSATSPART